MKYNHHYISVIIPAYNEEKYIGKCLAALRNQNYPTDGYEIIVVDNACTDATATVAASFGVRVVHESRKGVARARQRGAEIAQGEIIAGLDADSYPPPHWLSTIDQLFGSDPSLGAATGPVYLYDGRLPERLGQNYISNYSMRLTYLLERGWLVGHNFAVRKSIFFSIGGFDTRLLSAEDLDLAMRLQGVTRLAYEPHLVMYISGRRVREGYATVLTRSLANYIRVVFLKQPPYSGYVVDVR